MEIHPRGFAEEVLVERDRLVQELMLQRYTEEEALSQVIKFQKAKYNKV